ncbi:hypothetical protein [Streptomyces sp. NEAU-YJ-81]|uniref:hypothetical protein n=1 Tax=Streptomyces sp. NEAU-YJ-81 TaxID=2820288 RepID=UPI001ABC3ECE|nr:hypothetical protein [Streptomyces sp. NEAU-YJ-81]MBO3680826.1 hypothetical protein [Streptomyces sp. NEAU-YJ-81]
MPQGPGAGRHRTGRDPHRRGHLRIWRALVKSDVLSWTQQQHMDIYTALRAHHSLAAFTAASRHVGDVELWVRDRLDAVRDRR